MLSSPEIKPHVTQWLSRVLQIPSVSPDHAGPRAGEPGEGRLAGEVAGWFRAFGGEVHQEDVLPGRPNVYGIWRGRTNRWAAVDVHMDTVGVEQMIGDPFDGRVADGRVYGRGAADTKASLGVMLAMLEAMHQAGKTPETNLLLAATADEESGARGAPALAKWVRQRGLRLDELMVAEPTLCRPVHGHKGVSRLEFVVQGKSTHTSQPELGQNAITAAVRLINALEREHERLGSQPSKLGPPTLTVALVQGGRGINVVPDECRVSIDRRVVENEDATEVTANLKQLAQKSSPLPVSARLILQVPAFYQPPDTPWVERLAEWSGQSPSIVPFGTNAWAYGGLARECVVLGPGSISKAHGNEEWVEVSQLEKLAGIYARWWGV